MSEHEFTESVVTQACPVCGGPMESMETICAKCRAELEKAIMSVRAEDYPPPARVLSPGSELLDRESGVGSPIEAQLDAVLPDDMDLLPLAPVGDFVRSAAVATRPAANPRSEARVSARSLRPAPAPTPVEMDLPAPALRPQGTWKYALLAIVVTLGAGALGAVIWSMVVPSSVSDEAQPVTPAVVSPP